MMIKFGESGHPVFRATGPFSRGTLRIKGGGILSFHFCADGYTIEMFFRTIISVNQLSIYGAVSDLCEKYSSCQTRPGRFVVAEQSNPLFAPADLLIMTPTPSIEILAQENLLQKYKGRVENLPYTLPREDSTSQPKCWIQGNAKIGPVLEVTASYLQGEHGVEIRIESVNKDNSHSSVRISHGFNKLVTDLVGKEYDDIEQETSTTKTEVFAFASRSKAKAKSRRRSTAFSSSRTILILERT